MLFSPTSKSNKLFTIFQPHKQKTVQKNDYEGFSICGYLTYKYTINYKILIMFMVIIKYVYIYKQVYVWEHTYKYIIYISISK